MGVMSTQSLERSRAKAAYEAKQGQILYSFRLETASQGREAQRDSRDQRNYLPVCTKQVKHRTHTYMHVNERSWVRVIPVPAAKNGGRGSVFGETQDRHHTLLYFHISSSIILSWPGASFLQSSAAAMRREGHGSFKDGTKTLASSLTKGF